MRHEFERLVRAVNDLLNGNVQDLVANRMAVRIAMAGAQDALSSATASTGRFVIVDISDEATPKFVASFEDARVAKWFDYCAPEGVFGHYDQRRFRLVEV